MVALDYFACDIERLDAVGIDGALCEPLGAFYFLSFGFEHVDEACTDDLSLALGFADTSQFAIELFGGIDSHHIETEALVVAKHVGELVLAEKSVIDEDAGEVLADGTVEQDGCHGGIDTA